MVPNGTPNMNTRTAVPDNTLRPYVENRLSTYAAAAISVTNYERTFIIGDHQRYTLGSMEFVNSPLHENQPYVFFVRLYSSDPVSCAYSGRGREGGREGSLVPRPCPKIGKRAWSHLQKFPYVLCQQSSFGVEESCSSITNY